MAVSNQITKSIYSAFFLLMLLSNALASVEPDWSEKKLGRVIIKAEKAARLQDWTLAIEYGELVLEGSATLYQQSDPRYIGQLTNINRYYDKADRLSEVPERVEQGYELATKYLGPSQVTTRISRTLYFKLSITTHNYERAIPLVLETISLVGSGEQESHRKLHYFKQLYSLYGLTAQYDMEERALLDYLELNSQLFGNEDEDSKLAIKMLAQNYCRRTLLDEFNELVSRYALPFTCG